MESAAAYPQVREMSTPEWVSGPPRLEGDDIVLPTVSTPYVVSQREFKLGRSVLGDLLDVRDAGDVQRFARRWGLLYHGPGAPEFREPLADWFRIAGDLRLVLRLVHLLRASVATSRVEHAEKLRELLRRRVRIDPNRWPKDLQELDVERRADVVIVGLLNRGLQTTSLGVTSAALIGYPMATGDGGVVDARGQPGYFYTLTRFLDLVGYAYDTARRHIVEKTALYACIRCGQVRPRTHGLQKYCGSRCESAAREERRQARKVASAAARS